MLKRISLVAAFLLPFGLTASAQQDNPEAIKKAILKKVREKLAKERALILEHVGKIIDRELKRGGKPDRSKLSKGLAKRIRDLERKLRVLDDRRDELRTEILKIKRLAADEKIRRLAKEEGPKDAEEAQELFQEAINAHTAKEFKKSIKQFKILYYSFPKTEFGGICAYNSACGYALSGKKQHALDWLEISIAAGYKDFEHMRKDADLNTLRKEKRYLKLMTDN